MKMMRSVSRLTLVRSGITSSSLKCINNVRLLSSLPPHSIVNMPSLSPTMETGSIARWCIKEGDKFDAGTAICEVETDKATVTFDAQDEGYLAKILASVGEIKVGQPIMVTVESESAVAAFKDFVLDSTSISNNSKPVEAKPTPTPTPVASSPPVSAAPPTLSLSSSSSSSSRVIASPLARKLARETGIDLSLLQGTGPNGRIISIDVTSASPEKLASAKAASSKASSSADVSLPVAGKRLPASNGQVYSDFELSDLSKALAARMTLSKQLVPHYYLSVELNLSKLLEFRSSISTSDDKNVSVLDLLVKAAGLAVKQVPDVNGQWMDTFIRRYDQVDINVVMGTGSSIVTPVIRDVNAKGLFAISNEMAAFEDSLFKVDGVTIDENKVAPGTISIHNLGMYGIKSAAPIVLSPQAVALAFGAITDTVVPKVNCKANEDNWEVAPVMVATLSCDHRVVDGAVGAQWLAAFKTIVENPISMLL